MLIYPGFVYERWPETRRERYDSAIQRAGPNPDESIHKRRVASTSSSPREVGDKVMANGGNGLHRGKRSSPLSSSSFFCTKVRWSINWMLRTTGRIGYSIENNLTILSCWNRWLKRGAE